MFYARLTFLLYLCNHKDNKTMNLLRITKHSIYALTIMAAMLVLLTACNSTQAEQTSIVKADSLMNEAYLRHDYDSVLLLADRFEANHEMTPMKVHYWRGYAYSRQKKVRLAEKQWRKAFEISIDTEEDMDYYAKCANRLSGLLLVKGDHDAIMKDIVPAMQLLKEAKKDNSTDFAFMQVAVGSCQLQLGNPKDAADDFEDAYTKYLDIIRKDPSISNFTSAIVGVINMTEQNLAVRDYLEARDWTEHFAELLKQYMQLPSPDKVFLDKQLGRLNLYRATALQGLGHEAEAKAAYNRALKTNYAKTAEGQYEAISYLMTAQRWQEATRCFERLDELNQRYERTLSLEYLHNFLIPKYQANINAGKTDSALAVGTKIYVELDSAIVRMQRDDAAELATLYNTQQKETELAEQKAQMERHRFWNLVVVFVLFNIGFFLIHYLRVQSSKRLKKAYLQLEEANERTKEASRMKTSFIQQISHEIRTPLNILSGFTQVITTPGMELDEETRKDVNQKIIENTNRITGLVNKMLELSDANSKTVLDRNDHIPALQVVALAMDSFSNTEKCKIPIDLELGEGTDSLTITTNEQAARRALTLLLDNAEKFTKEGKITLKTEVDDKQVRFIVEDTGIGIPADKAEVIFEEFVQLDDYYEGTGIGLTVARSLCRRLEGEIVLDTSYTGGARFIMTLPLDSPQSQN